MNEASTVLGNAWVEVGEGIQQIMNYPVAALGLTLPIVGLVISVAKKLFRGRRG